MNLQGLEDFCLRSGWTDQSLQGLKNLVVRINSVLAYLGEMRDWPDLQRTGRLQTIVPYTTGTVAITKGSTAVVGTLTVFTAAMVGQHIQIDGSGAEYEIASVEDTTHLTLAEGFLATTVTVGTISIRYVRYATPTDLDRAGGFFHRTLGWLRSDLTRGAWLALRMSNPGLSTGPDRIFVARDYLYIHPAASTADQIWYSYQKRPVELKGNADETDWPQGLMWVLYAALAEAVRQRTEQAAMQVLELEGFQKVIDRAWSRIQPSSIPVQVAPDRRMTPGEFAGQFGIKVGG
ncbi:MAG TPA: hypothetical protein VMW52_08195 [Phycisphaerae bacterium]|nr:hypothetical protein [Phycisphaerae bacterium]